MSKVQHKLTFFTAALVLLFVVGGAFGRLLDPGAPGDRAGAHQEDANHGRADEHGAMAADPVRGLGVTENGLRLVVVDPERTRAASQLLRFKVVGGDGGVVTEFDETHTKRMHLIVVRRDLTGFQHLHPQMAANGTWAVPLRLDAAGSYRVFADFSHEGEATTLATDLRVDGAADLADLPAPASAARSEGGYLVRFEAEGARAAEPAQLRFTVSRDGRPVGLQSYLGAAGHLVALREGDLAFLHVHPEEQGLGFEATFPSPGRYRLFLQFRVDDQIQTVAFTAEVE